MPSSVRGLLGAVPVVMIGCLAIRGAALPAPWVITTAAFLFGLPALLSPSARPEWRSALIAFAWAGSLYLVLCFGPGLDLCELEYLPSTAALNRLFPVIFTEGYLQDLAVEREGCTCDRCVTDVRDGLRSGFLQAGHIVTALLAAALSGLAAWALSSYRGVGVRKEARPNPRLQRTPAAGR